MIGRHLRQAVDPVGLQPASGAGIYQAGICVPHEFDGFGGCCIGQAQDGEISRAQTGAPRGVILAALDVDLEKFEITAPGEQGVDSKSSRALLPVNEYPWLVHV